MHTHYTFSDSYIVVHLKRRAVCARWMARRKAVQKGAPPLQESLRTYWPIPYTGVIDSLTFHQVYYTFRLFLCLFFFSFLGWLVRQILGSWCSILWSYAVPYSDSVSCSDWSNSNHFSFHVFGVQNTLSWTNWINYPDYYPTRIYRNVFG